MVICLCQRECWRQAIRNSYSMAGGQLGNDDVWDEGADYEKEIQSCEWRRMQGVYEVVSWLYALVPSVSVCFERKV